MTQITIVTAQNVTLRIELANIGDRFLAAIIDFFIKIGIVLGLGLLFATIKLPGVFIGILLFAIWAFYSLFFEALMKGQTPGKRMMKIRVARLDGEQLTIGNLLLRWLMCIVDFPFTMTPTVGIATIIATKYNQRIGDLLANTILVSSKERTSLQSTFYKELEPGYTPIFARVDNLSSREAEIINQVLYLYQTEDNYELISLLAARIRETLQIETGMDDLTFLRTIIKDYNHSGVATETGTTEAFSFQGA